jgi:hypothetical protein
MTTLKLFPATFSWQRLSATLGAVACLSLCTLPGASLPDPQRVGLQAAARITAADYCFARVRRLTPERLPPSYLVLRLNIQVAYRNNGARPLIIPVEHERTVYTALKPGVMNVFRELPGIDGMVPSLKLMKELPPKVSPDNPSDPKNDVFVVIPARGDLVSPIFEEITLPVNHKLLLRHDPDLRGNRLYLRLQLKQQELLPALQTDLSDRWTRFGVPWTGNVMTNVVTIDVPRQFPQVKPCVDGPFETPDNYHENLGAK